MKIGKYEITEHDGKAYISALDDNGALTGESMELSERILDDVWMEEY